MAIAIIPINDSPNSDNRSNWLSMKQANEMICNQLQVEVNPKKFYKDWFNNFFYFDWRRAKRLLGNSENSQYFVEFKNKEQALNYYFHEYNVCFDEVLEDYKLVNDLIKPVIEAIYNCGYKIVSLNIG